jgi:WD40 repeat protein
MSVAFSPDGKAIASASNDKTIKLWNLEGRLLNTLSGHGDSVYSVAFSPDGKTITSASNDKTIKLWDRQGQLLTTLSGHSDGVTSVAFSPDGKTIASGGGVLDKTVILWNLDLDDLLARSCDWLHDYLNNPNNGMSEDDERRQICDGIKPSAPFLLDKGKSLVHEGKVREAIAAYTEAQKLDPTLEISADSWNSLCWYGSVHGYADILH